MHEQARLSCTGDHNYKGLKFLNSRHKKRLQLKPATTITMDKVKNQVHLLLYLQHTPPILQFPL